MDEKLTQQVANVMDVAAKATGFTIGTPINIPVIALGLSGIYAHQSLSYTVRYLGWGMSVLSGVWRGLPIISEPDKIWIAMKDGTTVRFKTGWFGGFILPTSEWNGDLPGKIGTVKRKRDGDCFIAIKGRDDVFLSKDSASGIEIIKKSR